MKFSRIVGTGSYLPEQVVDNSAFESRIDTSDAWIQERTGIKQRHIAPAEQSTCDLAEQAANAALQAAGISGSDLDLIVVGTTTPDRIYPSTACQLQARIGAGGCPAFDVQAVCSGFVYALGIVDKFVRAGGVENALVIGADCHSRLLDWDDRATCVLFGDGAGAAVIKADSEPGIMSTHLHADGSYEHLLYVEGGTPLGGGEFRPGSAFTAHARQRSFQVRSPHFAFESLQRHSMPTGSKRVILIG